MSAAFETILYDVADGWACVTLNRPERRNALSPQMQAELAQALWKADNDTRVHCVVLRGAGPSFCAGYDLGGGYVTSDEDASFQRGSASIADDIWQLERQQRHRMALFDMHKPVIAQVHGHCLAGGTDIALLCDIVIAATDAVFGFPPARNLGALPNHFWLYNIGPQWTKRLLLTGDTITGADAQQIGLVLKAVEPRYLTQEVEQLAGRMALIDADLLAANKRVVNLGLELMGARTLQRLAAEIDARGHKTAAALDFVQDVRANGLRSALAARDAKFGDGRARVNGPELRDANGVLMPP
jgi:enoyl-CoA hydratase